MKHLLRMGLGAVVAAGLAHAAAGQASPYPSGDVKKTYERLLKQIEAIPMYDNHAHPGFADDADVDAMASPPVAANPPKKGATSIPLISPVT